jgi:hypothetical protein
MSLNWVDLLVVIGATTFVMIAGMMLYHMWIMDLVARLMMRMLAYLKFTNGGLYGVKEFSKKEEQIFVQGSNETHNGA